jgi:hypothetical protein
MVDNIGYTILTRSENKPLCVRNMLFALLSLQEQLEITIITIITIKRYINKIRNLRRII